MATVISEPLPCIACGYELRGLSECSACPECGMAISRSMRGDRLTAADPNWVRTITRGQRLIANGLLVAVLSAVAAILVTVAFAFIATTRTLPLWVENIATVLIGICLAAIPIALAAAAAGVFLVTAQEGREIDRESQWSARNVARAAAIGTALACVATLLFTYLPLWGGVWQAARFASAIAFVALTTIASVALLKRLEVLIRRVPDAPLADRIEKERRFMRWGVPAAGFYVVMAAFAGGGLGAGWFGGILRLLACVGFIALIGLVLTIARLAGTMRQCAARFRLCLAVADET